MHSEKQQEQMLRQQEGMDAKRQGNSSFRIIINGQQRFGQAVLERFLNEGYNVVAVFSHPIGDSEKPDPLVEFAKMRGIPVFLPDLFDSPEVLQQFQSLNADLCVMAYVTTYVPEPIVRAPRLGTIEYHPSLLPRHRGPSPMNWAVIQGEKKTGLTIFYTDKDIDTGDILLQKEIEIGEDDTLKDVYFKKLFPMGVDALVESVEMLKAGNAPRTKQDVKQATHESWCTSANAKIDWTMPAREVYNLIRGCNPQPGAWTYFHGEKISVYDTVGPHDFTEQKEQKHQKEEPHSESAGTIVDCDSKGVSVMCGDGKVLTILVAKLPESQKLPVSQIASDLHIERGAIFQ